MQSFLSSFFLFIVRKTTAEGNGTNEADDPDAAMGTEQHAGAVHTKS